jgi:uncharacterized protein YdcH (DUF465 family)
MRAQEKHTDGAKEQEEPSMRDRIDRKQLEIETRQLESEAKELREVVDNLKREAAALGRVIDPEHQKPPDPEDCEEYIAAKKEIRQLKQERISMKDQMDSMRSVMAKIQGERVKNERALEQARSSSTTALRRAKMLAAIQGEGNAGTTPTKSTRRRWFEVKGEHLTGLRVYSEPAVDSEEVDTVFGGTSVEVVSEQEDGIWLQIVHRNQRGWVMRKIVTIEPEERGGLGVPCVCGCALWIFYNYNFPLSPISSFPDRSVSRSLSPPLPPLFTPPPSSPSSPPSPPTRPRVYRRRCRTKRGQRAIFRRRLLRRCPSLPEEGYELLPHSIQPCVVPVLPRA